MRHYTRAPLCPYRQSEYTHMWKKNNDGQSLPRVGKVASGASRFTKAPSARKQLIKPIYSYKKRKSNAANDFNVICRSGYRQMHEKSEAVHFYD